MSENSQDSLALLKKLELEFPEDLSESDPVDTPGSLQDFIKAPRTYKPGQALLLDLVQQLLCETNEDSAVRIAEPHTSREPGFSNQSTIYTPNHTETPLCCQKVVAAIVIKEHAKDTRYRRRIINEDVVQNVVACCEDRLINNTTKGLVRGKDEDAMQRPGNKTRMEFYYEVLKEYAIGTSRMPTHIVLPGTEILELFEEQRRGGSYQGFSNKLFGVPVISSDALSKRRGLIIAVDELVLCSSPGLKWEFGCNHGEFEQSDLSAIMLECKMGLWSKRPETIFQLSLAGTSP